MTDDCYLDTAQAHCQCDDAFKSYANDLVDFEISLKVHRSTSSILKLPRSERSAFGITALQRRDVPPLIPRFQEGIHQADNQGHTHSADYNAFLTFRGLVRVDEDTALTDRH
jgi:hypothetical protein